MTAHLRLGLIGCGRIAQHGHLPAVAASGRARLAAVADPDRGRRDAAAAPAGARAHATAEELFAAGGLDAVVIASPAAEHLAHARLAQGAGVPALVEKPPAGDAAGARELAALDPAPYIGFNRRFDQGLELIDRVPGDGPLELELELRYRRASWSAHEVRDDALLDLGPHLADLALLLGGGSASVLAARCSPERAVVELETARGPATIRCATDRPHRELVAVRRPGGRAVATAVRGGAARGAMARLRRRPHPLAASLALQLDAFAAAVAGDDPSLLATAADGLAAMSVVGAAQALARGEPVRVGAEPQPQPVP